MRIIDIRTKDIPEPSGQEESRVRFTMEVKRITQGQAKTLPHYEVELGKDEKKKRWFLSLRHIGFSFTTQFGIKRYRIVTWFSFYCFLLLFLMQGLSIASASLNLFQKGSLAARNASPQNLFAAMMAVKETNKSLASLGEIPKSLSDTFQALNLGSAWAEFFLRISGYYNPRSYLVIFENNAEIRATGGFMGSYALVNMDQGDLQIKKLEGIYNASGQQRVWVAPPLPIQKVSPSWMFHDANWFFDFPTSAKAISWFYEKTGGPTVDGVIALTPELIERLLALTGPIALPEFQIVIDDKNFINVIQYEVEINYKERGLQDPKEILAHLAPLLIKKMSQLDKQALISAVFDSLEHKEVMLYFDRPEEEAFMNYLHWGGALTQTKGDYLAVVNTNVNGYKTDRMITQIVRHRTHIEDDGSIIDALTITRRHNGGNEAYDWYNRVNGDFMRVYAPEGSQLLNVQGQTKEEQPSLPDYQAGDYTHYPALQKSMETATFDKENGTYIWQESGKTVFGNWVYVSPKESVTVTYTYRLPISLKSRASTATLPLTIQKQPGITYEFTKEWEAPPLWQTLWEYPAKTAATMIDKDTIYEKIFSIQ